MNKKFIGKEEMGEKTKMPDLLEMRDKLQDQDDIKNKTIDPKPQVLKEGEEIVKTIGQKLYDNTKKRKADREELKAKVLEEQNQECTFAPKINPNNKTQSRIKQRPAGAVRPYEQLLFI